MDLDHPYEDIKQKYAADLCWGMSANIDIRQCNHEKIRSPAIIRQYVKELCARIDMKRFGRTQVVFFGEEDAVAGYSMVQLIETSLISGHFANATNTAYFDVFSCKVYNPYDIAEFTRKFFDGNDSSLKITYRK